MLNIENYFGVPILTIDFNGNDLNKIQNEIDVALPKVRKQNLTNPWGDTVKTSFKYDGINRDIDTYKLITLRTNIFKAIESMIPNYNNFILKASWFNFSNKGDFQFDHNHEPEKLSGVYYYQTNGLDGNIRFATPNIGEKLGLGINYDRQSVSCVPVIGRLIIFPSYLEHRVEPNLTDNERISISFNIS